MRHHLQKEILNQLATAEKLRYADINTKNLDGNVFTYHVKQLISDKLVVQNKDKSYSLTGAGRDYIVHRYENSQMSAHSIFLVIIEHDDRLLLRRRNVQPMLGWSGFIHGEPAADKPLEQAVAQRIADKTGLVVESQTVISSGLIRISRGTELQSFSHAVIITATVASDTLTITQDDTGENFWINKADISSVEHLLPSCSDILNTTTAWFDHQYSI